MPDDASPPRLDLASACERLVLALDFPSASHTLHFLSDLRARSVCPPRWVKVGLELYLAAGPSLVSTLRAEQYSVFLDLKLHDIPNTVASAIRALLPLDVQLLTVHASGGPAMLAAAAEAAMADPQGPRLLAVTVLTSIDDAQLRAINVAASAEAHVLHLAHLAAASGIHGLVASPLEAASLRRELGPGTWLVTPGIRNALSPLIAPSAPLDDQHRTATPASALKAGADQLVIGRPVTRAVDPAAAYDALLTDIARATTQQ